mmetsp:Transcript_12723/g.38374  ORF Transcript_12723/g.38374 Transcript_12723/m.38374 type:complete len:334 (-) Transcript_12723:3450-4451(-)
MSISIVKPSFSGSRSTSSSLPFSSATKKDVTLVTSFRPPSIPVNTLSTHCSMCTRTGSSLPRPRVETRLSSAGRVTTPTPSKEVTRSDANEAAKVEDATSEKTEFWISVESSPGRAPLRNSGPSPLRTTSATPSATVCTADSPPRSRDTSPAASEAFKAEMLVSSRTTLMPAYKLSTTANAFSNPKVDKPSSGDDFTSCKTESTMDTTTCCVVTAVRSGAMERTVAVASKMRSEVEDSPPSALSCAARTRLIRREIVSEADASGLSCRARLLPKSNTELFSEKSCSAKLVNKDRLSSARPSLTVRTMSSSIAAVVFTSRAIAFAVVMTLGEKA